MSKKMYEKLNKNFRNNITKDEFSTWCSDALISIRNVNVETVFDTFKAGGPVEEEPDDGVPKMFSLTGDKSPGKK